MIAFYTNGKILVKAYQHGSDWQLLCDKQERWFSVWTNDKRASLVSAFSSFVGHEVNQDQIHGLRDIRA
jgi:hypothetical protein